MTTCDGCGDLMNGLHGYCEVCSAHMILAEAHLDDDGVMETCWQCGGDGGFHDCGEDCCACLEPELNLNRTCDICGGAGRYVVNPPATLAVDLARDGVTTDDPT